MIKAEVNRNEISLEVHGDVKTLLAELVLLVAGCAGQMTESNEGRDTMIDYVTDTLNNCVKGKDLI